MKLSIAFPTYSRAAYLRRAVDSVVGQLANVPSNVEIDLCIYDNASPDETPTVCAELVERESRIRVVRHADNVGGDANILGALKQADGDYVWVFGDDDYLLPGALRGVCDLLLTQRLNLLKMGTLEEREYAPGPVRAPLCAPLSHAGGHELAPERFVSAQACLERFGLGIGNFSSIIFACEFFRSAYRPVDDEFLQTGYSHLEWIYRGLYEHPNTMGYLAGPLLVIRIELSPRHVSGERVWRGLDLLRERLGKAGYAKSVVDVFVKRQRDAILVGNVKTRKITGVPIWFELRKSFHSVSNARSRIKLLLIAALPTFVYRRIWVRL